MCADVLPAGKETFVVVLEDFVVARDLAQIAAEYSPGCDVVIATTPAEAIAALATVGRVSAAFVAADPATFDGSALQAALASRNGRVLLIGEAAEMAGRGADWVALVRPFTAATVKNALALTSS